MGTKVADIVGEVGIDGIEAVERDLGRFDARVNQSGASQGRAATASMSHEQALRTLSGQAMLTGGVIVGAAALGVKGAADLETALAPIGTLLGANTKEGKDLTAAVKDLIATSPQSAEELGMSAYTILSAGISGTKNVMDTLRSSQKLAEAGLGDQADATDLVTSAMKAFSGENLTADKAAQLLFGTISLGKTTTSGLAQGFGEVAPLASAAGVSFRDMLAATAALTATGQTASVAYTGLRGVITNIIKPTSEAQDIAKKLGLEWSATHLKNVGLPKFLQEVKDKTGGNVETMARLFGSVEGVNAVLALTGPQAQAFQDNLGKMDGAGAKLNARAKEMQGTLGNTFKEVRNEVSVTASEALSPFIPLMHDVLGGVRDGVHWFGELPGPLRDIAVAGTGAAGVTLLLLGTIGKIAGSAAHAADAVKVMVTWITGHTAAVDVNTASEAANTGALEANTLAAGENAVAHEAAGGAMAASGGEAAAAEAGLLGLGSGALTAAAGVVAVGVGVYALSKILGDTEPNINSVKDHLGNLEHSTMPKLTERIREQREQIGEYNKSWRDISSVSPVALGSPPDLTPHLNSLKSLKLAMREALKEGPEMAMKFLDAARAAGVPEREIDKLNQTLMRTPGFIASTQAAAASYSASWAQVSGQLQATGFNVDRLTQAGKDNSVALQNAGESNKLFALSLYNETGNATLATMAISAHVQKLHDQMVAAGYSEIATQGYIETLYGIPRAAATKITNTADLAKYLADQLIATYNRVPGNKHTTFTGDASQLFATSRQVAWALAMLPSNAQASFYMASLGMRAKGGPTKAGEAYMVGEDGPEIWTENRDGYIIPNGVTPMVGGVPAMAMATPASAGGGERPIIINIAGSHIGDRDLVRTVRRGLAEETGRGGGR